MNHTNLIATTKATLVRSCAVRVVITFLALLALAGLTGCESVEGVTMSTETSTMARATTMHLAQVVQASQQDAELATASGESMQPIYSENTIFVVKPIAFEALQPGMKVAYRDPFGNQIVHQLCCLENGYWLIEGINNDNTDRYHVTRQNLVGYVYMSFQNAGDPAPIEGL